MLAAHHEGLVGTIIDPVASSAQPSRAKLGVTTMGFMDMREWISLLEKAGELRRVTAEVNWDREIGAVARRVLEKKGPALLFENIKGYGSGRCTRLFVSGLGARSRLALALGFPREVANRELVQHVMKKNRETIAPVVVATGPVKECIIRGDAIDQTEFPVPKWHHLEGGRYIHTFSGIVTRDPDTRVMNVGIYRGMIGRKDTAPFLLIKGGQHWGAHFVKWAARKEPMPVACVIGWDPIMPFLAGSPVAPGVCEWDVMGAYRSEPAQLVRCETVDLEVPASAEIVIEGTISDDPATYETEGPFGEFTGYVSDVPTTEEIADGTSRRDASPALRDRGQDSNVFGRAARKAALRATNGLSMQWIFSPRHGELNRERSDCAGAAGRDVRATSSLRSRAATGRGAVTRE